MHQPSTLSVLQNRCCSSLDYKYCEILSYNSPNILVLTVCEVITFELFRNPFIESLDFTQ